MSRFFVGQRVRIKWSLNFPKLKGSIGTVIGGLELRLHPNGNYEECYFVRPDEWSSDIAHGWKAPFSPAPAQLEPATYSYDKTSWSDCVWQPEHLRVTA